MKDSRYEEALERARQGLPIDEVFPELKESKDERIRTRLVALVEAFGQGKYKNEMLAYLEKQKAQQPAEWSEEDKKMLGKVLECIRFAEDRYQLEEEDTNGVSVKLWLLDHINPQPHWKPSEYTLSLVKKVANGEMLTHMEQMSVETLCNDLQKLL